MKLLWSLAAAIAANYCDNPDETFFGTNSVNARKDDVCTYPKKDGRYCYVKCLDGYFPPAGFETRMTKITCKCSDARGCQWVTQKPFIGCVGPCEQPLREFGSIKSFFKVKADYSQGTESRIFATPTDSVHVVFRVQSKTPLNNGWTLALQFEGPQMFKISSADVDFKWNCRRTILTATPKRFNFALNAKRSHNFMALVEGAASDEIDGSFRMFLYDGIIDRDAANCLDQDFGPDYCPDKPDPTKPDPTTTSTIAPTITLPTIDPTDPDPTEPEPTEPEPTEPEPTKPEPTEPEPTKPDPTEPEPTKPDPTITSTVGPTITLPTIDPTEPDPTKPDPTEPEPTEPEPTEPEPTKPDPTEPEPTEPEPTQPEPTCTDPDATYGIKEHKTGKGGCPPRPINYSLVDAERQARIPLDANACHGTHIDAKSYVNAGVGAEDGFRNRDAFVSRFNLCDDLSQYGSRAESMATDITRIGTDCSQNLAWAWTSDKSGIDDQFGYVAVSPDKTYLIAAGVIAGEQPAEFKRWLVKIDATTGRSIWEIILPSDDQKIGFASGYESIQFTSDGGFIAGGWAKGDYLQMPSYKSGGQIDGGVPLAQKFGRDVAEASFLISRNPTPEWTYVCGTSMERSDTFMMAPMAFGMANQLDQEKQCKDVLSSVNTMRIFVENGVEKMATTFRIPTAGVLTLNVRDGSEDRFIQTTSRGDSFQDLEVEQENENGNVSGFVIAGLTKGKDVISDGCTKDSPCPSWDGFILKLGPEGESWRRQFTSFPGGVGNYVNLPIYGGSLVYTECFSIAKIPGGYVTACGQGMESEEGQGVEGDPRADWRGTAVAVDMKGNMSWYRMENWGVGLTEDGQVLRTASSAFEWVSTTPEDSSSLVFFSDESYGYGFATFDLRNLEQQ